MKSSLKNFLQMLLVLTLVSTSTVFNFAKAIPFTLKPLKSTQKITDVEANGLTTITMIFQPDCSWCKKQGKALTKIFQQCQSSMNVALVGTKGNARQLRKELKHYHQDIPSFIADRKFLRQIGGYQASPTTLIFNDKGELIGNKRGFIPEDKLAKAVNILTDGTCQI